MRRTRGIANKVYVATRKSPPFIWSASIRQVVWQSLKDLKCADIPKIVGTVLDSGRYHTSQRDQDQQIRWHLNDFVRKGYARTMKDRRYYVSAEVREAMQGVARRPSSRPAAPSEPRLKAGFRR